MSAKEVHKELLADAMRVVLRWRAAAMVVLAFAGVGPVTGAQPEILDSGLRLEAVEQRPYRAYVRECLDALITSGTDRYGR